jgi:hypothetical protein
LNCLNPAPLQDGADLLSLHAARQIFPTKTVSAFFAAHDSAIIFGKSIHFKMLLDGTKLAGQSAFGPESIMSISFPGVGATPVTATKSALTAKPADSKTAEQKFLEWADMTPAERMHAQMLSQLGITEDQFKAMDPAAQQKIEEKFAT